MEPRRQRAGQAPSFPPPAGLSRDRLTGQGGRKAEPRDGTDTESVVLPVAFRLGRPKRSCSAPAYRTKLQLAEQLVKDVVTAGRAFE